MKQLIILLCMIISPVIAFADRGDGEQIILNHKGTGGHLETYPSADMPDAYYDSDENEIIIIGYGFSSYYNVLIIRNSTNQTMVSTQIDGYEDSIDTSSLPADNYIIVITSEYNNVFEGQFTII